VLLSASATIGKQALCRQKGRIIGQRRTVKIHGRWHLFKFFLRTEVHRNLSVNYRIDGQEIALNMKANLVECSETAPERIAAI
jgi:hypothetical protein